jgi:hypothetical protein
MLTNLDHIRNPIVVCTHAVLHSKIVVVIGVARYVENIWSADFEVAAEYIQSQYK